MDVGLTVRFSEVQGYDINQDCETVRFIATTGRGSFFADTALVSSRVLREDRERFKDTVLEAMQNGHDGGEIDLGD